MSTSSLRNTDFRSLLNNVNPKTSQKPEDKNSHGKTADKINTTGTNNDRKRNRQRYLEILKRRQQREQKQSKAPVRPSSASGKGSQQQITSTSASGTVFRDRAEERRKQIGEYAQVCTEYELLKNKTEEESKFLGGDIEHTHLVKGLDYVLLNTVRSEIEKKKRIEEESKSGVLSVIEDEKDDVFDGPEELEATTAGRDVLGVPSRKYIEKSAHHVKQAGKSDFLPLTAEQLARSAVLSERLLRELAHSLHPHHIGFSKKIAKIQKVIYRGSHFVGNTKQFVSGRLVYRFDLSPPSGGCFEGENSVPVLILQTEQEGTKKLGSLQNDSGKLMDEGVVAPLPDVLYAALHASLRSKGAQRLFELRKNIEAQTAVSETGISRDGVSSETISHTGINTASEELVFPKSDVQQQNNDADDEEDIFGGVGRFDPGAEVFQWPVETEGLQEPGSSNTKSMSFAPSVETPSTSTASARTTHHYFGEDASAMTDTRQPCGTSEQCATFQPSSKGGSTEPLLHKHKTQPAPATGDKNRRTEANPLPPSTMNDGYSECYPLMDDGFENTVWDAGSDDDDQKSKKRKGKKKQDDSGDERKPQKSARALRRQAEREWQQVEGYIAAKKHRNLDALEHDIAQDHTRASSRSMLADLL